MVVNWTVLKSNSPKEENWAVQRYKVRRYIGAKVNGHKNETGRSFFEALKVRFHAFIEISSF